MLQKNTNYFEFCVQHQKSTQKSPQVRPQYSAKHL
jgi:hypothetical protein